MKISQSSSAGTETRTRLIEVAAKHFAEYGFGAASQRAIQREAGVNPASAHYHFGSKAAMYRAVIDMFVHDVQEERIARLEAPPGAMSPTARVHHLLASYYAPGFQVATTESGFDYARILARSQGERNSEARHIFNEVVGPVRERYIDSLQQTMPEIARENLYEMLAMGVTIMAISAVGSRYDHLMAPGGPDREADRLATIITTGYLALLKAEDTQG